MNRKTMIGPIQVQFRSDGHLCTMTMSGEKTLVKRISDETEMFEDFEFPTWIELTTSGGADPDMHTRVELRDGSPQLVELSWKCQPGQGEIRQKHLRQTDPVKLVIDLVVSVISGPATVIHSLDALEPSRRAEVEREMSFKKFRDEKRIAEKFVERQRLPRERRVMTDDFLQRVADVYRENIDGTPTKAVGTAFNVQPRMASKYVERARQKGLLSPTDRGRKKA